MIKAILDAPAPQLNQLGTFLGLRNYYGRFMSLHQLLCLHKAGKCTEQCDKAFLKTKKTLLKSEAIVHPNRVACNAGPCGVEAVVSHIMTSGEEMPIAFASRTLSRK